MSKKFTNILAGIGTTPSFFLGEGCRDFFEPVLSVSLYKINLKFSLIYSITCRKG